MFGLQCSLTVMQSLWPVTWRKPRAAMHAGSRPWTIGPNTRVMIYGIWSMVQRCTTPLAAGQSDPAVTVPAGNGGCIGTGRPQQREVGIGGGRLSRAAVRSGRRRRARAPRTRP